MEHVVALIWLAAAVVLAGAEAATGTFYLLMLAGGALITAGVSGLTDLPVWGDAVVFAGVSLALLVGVRPMLLRRFGTPPELQTNVAALTGRQAIVTEQVALDSGQVKLSGEIWTARPLDSAAVYHPGDTVTVLKIDGATAIVFKEA